MSVLITHHTQLVPAGQTWAADTVQYGRTCSVPIISSRIREQDIFREEREAALPAFLHLLLPLDPVHGEVVQRRNVDKTEGFSFLLSPQLWIKGGQQRGMRCLRGEAGLAGLAPNTLVIGLGPPWTDRQMLAARSACRGPR